MLGIILSICMLLIVIILRIREQKEVVVKLSIWQKIGVALLYVFAVVALTSCFMYLGKMVRGLDLPALFQNIISFIIIVIGLTIMMYIIEKIRPIIIKVK